MELDERGDSEGLLIEPKEPRNEAFKNSYPFDKKSKVDWLL